MLSQLKVLANFLKIRCLASQTVTEPADSQFNPFDKTFGKLEHFGNTAALWIPLASSRTQIYILL
jgi:hypothetical protein